MPNTYIEDYIVRAKKAMQEFKSFSQKETDKAVMLIAKTVHDNAESLAKLAVKETLMGNVEDKIAKNKMKVKVIWHSLKGKKSKGIIGREEGIIKIANPVGVVAAITPITNPIVTPMSNAMFALKGGNAIIITPHHKAIKSSTKTVELINKVLAKNKFPKNLIQILDEQSRENTKSLIESVDKVIATGGAGMVKAAYSSGKPALGVGAGNVQVIIDKGYDLNIAIPKIISGRAFDNGIICSGEQSIILPKDELDNLKKIFKKEKVLYLDDEKEVKKLRDTLFIDEKLNRHVVGANTKTILDLAKINVKEKVKVIGVLADGVGDVLGKEKMCPVFSIYTYSNINEAIKIAENNLEKEGKGHSVAIHSNNEKTIEKIITSLLVSRFIINASSATTAGGSFYNNLAPTNTLGCGSWGGNSISENVTYKHLINISRCAFELPKKRIPTEKELWKV